jgi:hypothetical protein
MNVVQTYKYINTELKVLAIKKLIWNVCEEMRKVICKNLKLEYQSRLLRNKNDGKYYAVDETLIYHIYPHGVFMMFVGEIEDNEQKIKNFFDIYHLTENVEDTYLLNE